MIIVYLALALDAGIDLTQAHPTSFTRALGWLCLATLFAAASFNYLNRSDS